MNPFDLYDLARVRFERNPRLAELEAEAALDKRRSEKAKLERAAFLFHCLAGIGTIEWQRNWLKGRNLL